VFPVQFVYVKYRYRKMSLPLPRYYRFPH